MSHPDDLMYSANHVWVKRDKNVATIGLTDDIQEQVQHIDSVDLPHVGDELEIDEACASLHLKNELFDIPAPLSGRVLEANPVLTGTPDEILIDPYRGGWLLRMEVDDPEELHLLMDADEYALMLD